MKLLLDTNVVSATRRLHRQEASFQAFMSGFDAADAYLSAITVMEIEVGIERERRRDPIFAAELGGWLSERVLSEFEGRVLSFDSPAARLCGRLPTPEGQPTNDAMIAATAILHGLTVATRNVADFKDWDVPLLNPWQA